MEGRDLPRSVHVTAPDQPADALAQLAAGLAPDLTLRLGADDAACAAPRVLLLAAPDRAALSAALAQDYDRYVEWTDPAETAAALRRADAPLAVSLTARTAYRCLNGRMLGALLVARGVIAPAAAANVGGSVQEALANAIIHGNLGLGGASAAGADGFAHFHGAVAERLAGPAGACRRVTVGVAWSAATVSVTVSDDGAGFAAPAAPAAPGDGSTSGRGLLVMRRLADRVEFENGGRSAVLTYARAP